MKANTQALILDYADTPLVSGRSKYHTAAHTASNSEPFNTISINQIVALISEPPCVPKERAPWVITTDYTGEYARSANQLQYENFYAAWADIDSGNTPIEAIKEVLEPLECNIIIYSSRSATEQNKKWRLIIPYEEPQPASQHKLVQECLNDLLEANGMQPDRVTQRINQLCYLPNRGEHYEHFIESGKGGLA